MIPSGTRFIGYADTVNLEEKKSKVVNSQSAVYTVDDIKGYKVYTALLTQSGADDNFMIAEVNLSLGVTYTVDGGNEINDFSNVGGWVNMKKGESFVSNSNNYPNNWGDTYLRYIAGAPVATVLENTIGNIWFTYVDVGYYRMNSNTLFTDGKTAASIGVPMFIESPDDIYSSGVFINTEENLAISSYYNYNVANDALNYSGGQWIEVRVYN